MRNLLRNKSVPPILCLVASLLTLGACNEQKVRFHTYRSVPKKGWPVTDTLRFEADIPDSMTTLRLSIGVRYRSDYPYHELPLIITCTDADSLHLSTDTLILTLADESGKWSGEGLSGMYQSGKEVRRINISKAGRYGIEISHVAESDTLRGVSDIGIKIE